MLDDQIKRTLSRLCVEYGGRILYDYPLSGHSTIAIGGKAAALCRPASLEGLKKAKALLDKSGIKVIVMGFGSNTLVPDNELDAVVMNLSGDFFEKIEIKGRTVTVGAGAGLDRLITRCCRRGLAALETLTGIPSTVGGALFTNASYRTAISERLVKVSVLDASGQIRWLEKKDLEFGYRYSSFDKGQIIVRAVFSLEKESPSILNSRLRTYLEEKRKKQPLEKKTLGCVFKNVPGYEYTSGELIEKVGMKGHFRGGAQVSEKHANFILNAGKATSEDVICLMDDIRKRVKGRFFVELEPEIEIL